MPMNRPTKKVIIIGGGFGGLRAAKTLGGVSGIEVILLDRRNHHLFQPLLYQVATAGLSPAEIATPIRSVLAAYKNITVELAEVVALDIKNKTVQTKDDLLPFDYLILAAGAEQSYFGHPEWEKAAPGLKSLENATEIRRRLLLAFELAEKEKNPELQKALLTFVVVGGGPTGVELAGAISEISRFTLEKDFRNIDPSRTRIILIEAGSRLLSAFSPALSKKAAQDLEKIGVQIWTNTRVTEISENHVRLGEEVLKTSTIVWAAGVKPSPLCGQLQKAGAALDRTGRVLVQNDLTLKDHPHIFTIGDMAAFTDTTGSTLPGLAPVAIQQGKHAAKNIILAIKAQTLKPFHYRDKGQMATIGRKKAVMQAFGLEMSGLFAWLAWLFIHIYYLVGFKNKFFVFLQWAWSYVTFRRGARLILYK